MDFLKIIDNLDTYVFGPVGFIISVISLCITLIVKSKIDSALAKKDLRVNYKKLLDELNKFAESIPNTIDQTSAPNLNPFRKWLGTLQEQYGPVDKQIIKLAQTIEVKIGAQDYDSVPNLIGRLAGIIKKEAKNG